MQMLTIYLIPKCQITNRIRVSTRRDGYILEVIETDISSYHTPKF
jgi:hypothetical protein